MPSINRIRVNNVKYNFGTQEYDDFSMKMYGRNTLYDLANGGGKSVLMLLLMQNLIPNSTLDDKQPIEKLFRDSSNTVIHSLIEWKLDPSEAKEGLRFMTTGFAAKKATTGEVEVSGENQGKESEFETARIEYFNYVIFYREYNKNDIINLPLEKDNERISYKALKNYLHDLSRNDKNLVVHIFDRKGEYQRFIADYGLYESQWEIIRGINKTEGHVRTYFETNYKTTRKVIEDLLIEEIIEKAYHTKTERESEKTESTVTLLMTIQEELRTLAEKKKDIQMYDHECQLVELLSSRVDSFMDLYKKQDEVAKECGRVAKTLEIEKTERETKKAELIAKVEEARRDLAHAISLYEILKIYKELSAYQERKDNIEKLEMEEERIKEKLEHSSTIMKNLKAAAEYLEMKRQEEELEALKKDRDNITNGISNGMNDIYAITYNIHRLIDGQLNDLTGKISSTEEWIRQLEEEISLRAKKKSEAETELAVLDSRSDYADIELKDIDKTLDELRDDIEYSLMIDPASSYKDRSDRLEKAEKRLLGNEQDKRECQAQLDDIRSEYMDRTNQRKGIIKSLEELDQLIDQYAKIKPKYTSISTIYAGAKDVRPEVLLDNLRDRISGNVINIYELKQSVSELEEREKEIRDGKLISETYGVKHVIDYLFTRHSSDAMYGMDYLSALPEERKEKLLKKLPGLPYGVVVRNLDSLKDDPGLKELNIEEEILLYDRDMLDTIDIYLGDGAYFVRRQPDFFIDPKNLDRKLRILGGELDNKKEELRTAEQMLDTINEDMDFVRSLIDKDYMKAEEQKEALSKERDLLEKSMKEMADQELMLKNKLYKLDDEAEELGSNIRKYQAELISLNKLVSVQDREDSLLKEKEKYKKDKEAILERLEDIKHSEDKTMSELVMQRGNLEGLKQKRDEITFKWENKFSPYYIESKFIKSDMNFQELERAFDSVVGGAKGRISSEKEKLLMDTLTSSIERCRRSIAELGVDIEDIKKKEKELIAVNPEVIAGLNKEIAEIKDKSDRIRGEKIKQLNELAKLEGSIEYARTRLVGEHGQEALDKLDNLEEEYTQDIRRSIEKAMLLCNDKKEALSRAEADEKAFNNKVKGNDDLLKLANRIVETASIDLGSLTIIESDDLREIFEMNLVEYDKVTKAIDRAKSDIMKVKLKVYETLNEMKALELAASIRDDVNIPNNRQEAEGLRSRLKDVTDIIILERDRIEKSLDSMEKLKESFVNQCVERCLDVKSELDKLTKLSEINMDGERIQMIKLSIPYVKDEFIEERMSQYIDHIVEELDKKESDAERQKTLSINLAMKKLFSVIVSDMSKIRLQLYKRERIKEQSRYLRYEEAVGSTGQSQGIYIQFLISIINYISGMYATAGSEKRSKTLFIDNPFGAAKDIYIWEPIFNLLAENSCQLIVPARGATPEITGRFDINYVLGQQMKGNKTTTVVVSYSSKTKGEEMEYKSLDYEQATFDFV
ncbi:MAG: hypothetical protein K6E10_00985 [Eubacterium sp.]|nr:hypothetical protein [Eubacterium sp.]